MNWFSKILGGADRAAEQPWPDEALVVDVRSPAEYQSGHVEGALRACYHLFHWCEAGWPSANQGACRRPDRASGQGTQRRVALGQPASLRVGAQKADRGVANPRWVTDPAAVGALR